MVLYDTAKRHLEYVLEVYSKASISNGEKEWMRQHIEALTDLVDRMEKDLPKIPSGIEMSLKKAKLIGWT